VKDLDADRVADMVAGEGEVIVTSNRGAHRWDAGRKTWRRLDTGAVLRNPAISAVAAVGDELWVSYTNQAFGVIGEQGISRYDERGGKWSYWSPRELGTASPVRAIHVAPKEKGDVWVLFARRRWGGAAMEYPFYPREARRPAAAGLGRFHLSTGKWEFPAKLEGVPASRVVEQTTPDGKVSKYTEQLPVTGLVLAGDRVFVANRAGLYEGPGKWKRLLEGPIWAVVLSKDQKELVVLRNDPEARDQNGFQRGTYNLAANRWAFRKVGYEEASPLFDGKEDSTGVPEEQSVTGWATIPTAAHGTWGLGPLGEDQHRVIATARAYWVVSPGELVRLDRAKLTALLKKGSE
jgi:hypothetical protein